VGVVRLNGRYNEGFVRYQSDEALFVMLGTKKSSDSKIPDDLQNNNGGRNIE